MAKSDNTDKIPSVDLTGEVCPMTFVRAKVALEDVESDRLVDLVIRGAEALQDIPRSLKAEGHLIEDVRRDEDGTCTLRVRKDGIKTR